MIYFSGKVSQLVKATCYAIVGGLTLVQRDKAHRVRVYHGKAFVDCAVDGDNDPTTCLSDFTVQSAFRFNAGYVFGSAFCFAALASLIGFALHKQHHFSRTYYYESIVVNAMITFGIAVLCGTQELSTLILLGINTFMYEAGLYIHDMGFWSSGTTTGYNHWGRISILISLNVITWGVILGGLVEYWSQSSIPVFIPTLYLLGLSHMIMTRTFHFRYFYGTLPRRVSRKEISEESQGLFEPYSGFQNKFDTLFKSEDPFVIDWGDSWKNVLDLTFRTAVGLVFYLGTTSIKITYQ